MRLNSKSEVLWADGNRSLTVGGLLNLKMSVLHSKMRCQSLSVNDLSNVGWLGLAFGVKQRKIILFSRKVQAHPGSELALDAYAFLKGSGQDKMGISENCLANFAFYHAPDNRLLGASAPSAH